jgi:hypothetical protein
MVDQIPVFYHNRRTIHLQEEGPADALEFLDRLTSPVPVSGENSIPVS